MSFLVGWFIWQSKDIPDIELPFLSLTPISDETANWKTYRNEEYGFEIKYPQDWIVDERKSYLCPVWLNIGIQEVRPNNPKIKYDGPIFEIKACNENENEHIASKIQNDGLIIIQHKNLVAGGIDADQYGFVPLSDFIEGIPTVIYDYLKENKFVLEEEILISNPNNNSLMILSLLGDKSNNILERMLAIFRFLE